MNDSPCRSWMAVESSSSSQCARMDPCTPWIFDGRDNLMILHLLLTFIACDVDRECSVAILSKDSASRGRPTRLPDSATLRWSLQCRNPSREIRGSRACVAAFVPTRLDGGTGRHVRRFGLGVGHCSKRGIKSRCVTRLGTLHIGPTSLRSACLNKCL